MNQLGTAKHIDHCEEQQHLNILSYPSKNHHYYIRFKTNYVDKTLLMN